VTERGVFFVVVGNGRTVLRKLLVTVLLGNLTALLAVAIPVSLHGSPAGHTRQPLGKNEASGRRTEPVAKA